MAQQVASVLLPCRRPERGLLRMLKVTIVGAGGTTTILQLKEDPVLRRESRQTSPKPKRKPNLMAPKVKGKSAFHRQATQRENPQTQYTTSTQHDMSKSKLNKDNKTETDRYPPEGFTQVRVKQNQHLPPFPPWFCSLGT